MDTTFRTKSTSAPEVAPVATKSDATFNESEIEVPYTDYRRMKGHSHSVDYFGLGDNYDVFSNEINEIDTYFREKINSGEIANSRSAVEREIKEMEKLNKTEFEERPIVKIGVLYEYIKFLQSTTRTKKYAN